MARPARSPSRSSTHAAWFLLLIAAAVAPAAALDRLAIEQAIALGRTASESDLRRFDDGYRIPLDLASLDSLDVITEFRRVVDWTADHRRLGDLTWGYAQAEEQLRPWVNRVSLRVRVTLPPQNVYRTLPSYDVVIFDRGDASPAAWIKPLDVRETPTYVAGQLAPPGSPMLGGTIEAVFDAGRVDRTRPILAGIYTEGREITRVTIDLSRLR